MPPSLPPPTSMDGRSRGCDLSQFALCAKATDKSWLYQQEPSNAPGHGPEAGHGYRLFLTTFRFACLLASLLEVSVVPLGDTAPAWLSWCVHAVETLPPLCAVTSIACLPVWYRADHHMVPGGIICMCVFACVGRPPFVSMSCPVW